MTLALPAAPRAIQAAKMYVTNRNISAGVGVKPSTTIAYGVRAGEDEAQFHRPTIAVFIVLTALQRFGDWHRMRQQQWCAPSVTIPLVVDGDEPRWI
jgi:hypothetical protein